MIAAFVAALMSQPAIVPTAAIPPPIASAVILRAGTPVAFVTESAIDSRSARQGRRFSLIVIDDVSVDGRLVLQKGTRAVGEVEAVSGKGMFGKAGSLVLRPLFVEIGSQRIYLDGQVEQRGKEQVGGAAVATFAAGALGLIITGKSATLPAGSRLDGRTRSDAMIAWPIR